MYMQNLLISIFLFKKLKNLPHQLISRFMEIQGLNYPHLKKRLIFAALLFKTRLLKVGLIFVENHCTKMLFNIPTAVYKI
uniref:Uncharacterized protein n=1 Tax=Lepeophtheirus salmonis TaxID=72036 RepID=A0A0K2V565_LEPSM